MRFVEPVAEVPLEEAHQHRVTRDLDPHRQRDALDRDVVVGGPDPTRREHDVVGAAEGHDFLGDQRDFVGNDGDASYVDAERAELPAQVRGVGVGDLPGEDLVADENDASGLRHRPRAILRC